MTGFLTLRRIAGLLAAVLVVLFVLALPFMVTSGDIFFWDTVAVAVLFATSTNLLFGQAGIPSFGQAGFYAAGAYTAALAAQRGWPVLAVLLLAIVIAATLSAIAALVAWRITGLAFSMFTLAVAQSLYSFALKNGTLGGYNGLTGFSATSVAGIDVTDPGFFWYVVVVIVALGCFGFWVISRSSFGLTMRAIREDPVRSLFLGVNVRGYRVLAFALAGAGAGLAGALSAYVNLVVTPDTAYWTASAEPIIMLLLGGMSFFFGPAVGAVLLTALMHKLMNMTHAYVLYVGILLYLILLFLPRGVLSLPEVARAFRRRLSGDAQAAAAGTASEPAAEAADATEQETSIVGRGRTQ